MKDFIKIKDERIRKSTLKKYSPFGKLKINLYFNVSRYRIELETISFDSQNERDEMIEKLDLEFGLTD